VLYELFISPPEEDPLYPDKMELLAASGLGTVHYLTEGLETKVGGSGDTLLLAQGLPGVNPHSHL
jgi:hypothetical protein